MLRSFKRKIATAGEYWNIYINRCFSKFYYYVSGIRSVICVKPFSEDEVVSEIIRNSGVRFEIVNFKKENI